MKNTIFALMFISIGAKAQSNFTVTVDSFFNFKFEKSLSASVALNTKNFIELDGSVGKTIITVNEKNLTILMQFDSTLHTLHILGQSNGNNDAYIYEYKEVDKMIRGQMSFVYSSTGERYVLAESQDENPNYQKAWIAKIR